MITTPPLLNSGGSLGGVAAVEGKIGEEAKPGGSLLYTFASLKPSLGYSTTLPPE